MAKGEAAEIVTGAPVPEGADAVVMVEDTERQNNDAAGLQFRDEIRERDEERRRHKKR